MPPSDSVRAELVSFLHQDSLRLGQVYRLTERGLRPSEIAAQLGVRTSGFVSNYRAYALALLDGVIPTGPAIAHQTASQVRRVLGNRALSAEAAAYLTGLLQDLDRIASGRAGRTRRTRSRFDRRTHGAGALSIGGAEPQSADGPALTASVDTPSPRADVSTEVQRLIWDDQSRLGQVYRLTEQGLDPESIAKELGVNTSNFVFNNRIIARALIEGEAPGGDSLKRAAAARARKLLRMPDVSSAARSYLGALSQALHPRKVDDQDTARPAARPQQAPRPQISASRLRGMIENLIQRIELETDVQPSDYRELAEAPDPALAVSRHIGQSKAGPTFLELFLRQRLDLTLESFVVRFGRQLSIDEPDRQMAEDRMNYFSELE